MSEHLDRVIRRLCDGDRRGHKFPLAPTQAAEYIVAELLPDLPAERRDAVSLVIEEWGGRWGDATASVEFESHRG